MNTTVYFVPVVDTSWKALGPLNPRKNYSCPPPPLELCEKEANGVVDLHKSLYDGRIAIAVYTGTYCRDEWTNEKFLPIWKRAIDNGGDILIHTHEEIARTGTRNSEKEHMYEVIRRQYKRLTEAGIKPAGFRGGLFGYANFLTPLMEELELNYEFSAAPEINKPDREAVWTGVPDTAFMLCRDDKLNLDPDCKKSTVLEIPLGWDGIGTENDNYLYVDYDLSSLDNAKRIWDKVLERYIKEGKPQIIHTLFHTFSMSDTDMISRYVRFAEYMKETGGVAVTPKEAKEKFEVLS